MCVPFASRCTSSSVCSASSRVGSSTSADGKQRLRGARKRDVLSATPSIGTRYAADLPLPVCDVASRSRPGGRKTGKRGAGGRVAEGNVHR
eukprot:354365-Chlamydomonas_euryale.AAC.1